MMGIMLFRMSRCLVYVSGLWPREDQEEKALTYELVGPTYVEKT